MKTKKIQFTVVFLLIFIAFTAYAGDFKNLVMFGDSTSDSGNFYVVSDGEPQDPYFEGRYSDGPVWIEYLMDRLCITGKYLNYAHAGAQTGETNYSGEYPGFLTQIDAYIDVLDISRQFPSAFAMPNESLFVIWIGGNDLWEVTDPETSISQAMSNIQAGMIKLITEGATSFLLLNLPDLGKTPQFNKEPLLSAQVSQLTIAFNMALEQLFASLENSNSNLDLKRIDTFSFLNDLIENYEAFGFINAMDSKLDIEQGIINDGAYVFWDGAHPTTITHKLAAEWIADQITCLSCKENLLPYFDEGFTITVPCIELDGNAYSFKLLPFMNTNEEGGAYWQLDFTTLMPNN